MKALVKTAPGKDNMELVDKPIPVPRDNELLIKVLAAGICGSDIHLEDGEYPFLPNQTIGHEYTGYVESMGKDVVGWEVGDQAVSFTICESCGTCRYCRVGLKQLCDNRKGFGGKYAGGMAEYIAVPYDICFKVPESGKGKDFWALVEPAACCLRATMEQTKIDAGDTVLVVGPGTMGLFCMQLAILQGATVIVSGTKTDGARLELAKKLGAAAVCDDPEKLQEVVDAIAPGGVDFAFEVSGHPGGLQNCVEMVRKCGTVSLVGLMGRRINFDLDQFLYKELTVTTNNASEMSSHAKVMELAEQGLLNLEALISDRLPLTEWEEGFKRARNKSGFKVLLMP